LLLVATSDKFPRSANPHSRNEVKAIPPCPPSKPKIGGWGSKNRKKIRPDWSEEGVKTRTPMHQSRQRLSWLGMQFPGRFQEGDSAHALTAVWMKSLRKNLVAVLLHVPHETYKAHELVASHRCTSTSTCRMLASSNTPWTAEVRATNSPPSMSSFKMSMRV